MEKKWCSMKEHVTCTAETHRKVIRMVSPMSELEAKLMLGRARDANNYSLFGNFWVNLDINCKVNVDFFEKSIDI